MIVDLPMYDWPAIRAETDAFWSSAAAELRADGIEAPGRLARLADYAGGWRDPDLLLGQTCGMPFVSGLCGGAVVVARPDYGLPQAEGGSYSSVILVRRDEAQGIRPEAVLAQRGRRVAVNEWRSYSGHIALRAHLAGLHGDGAAPFFGSAVLSGGHLASARMVAKGEADVAAVDGVVWSSARSARAGDGGETRDNRRHGAGAGAAVHHRAAQCGSGSAAGCGAGPRGGGATAGAGPAAPGRSGLRRRLCADQDRGAARAGRGLRARREAGSGRLRRRQARFAPIFSAT